MHVKVCLAVLFLVSLSLANDNHRYSGTKSDSWILPANAKVEIHVRAADVNVIPGDKEKLSVTVQTHAETQSYIERVTLSFDLQGSTGVLTVEEPTHGGGGSTVTVKVPNGTDLIFRGRAGDVDIGTSSGSKDVETSAGDVRVTIGPETQYADIDVSTHAGDVSGTTCGKAKGWIGSSLECTGQGKDHIRVRTTAGDIELREQATGATVAE